MKPLYKADLHVLRDCQKLAEMGKRAREFTVRRGANAGEAYSTILRQQPVAVNF